MSYIWHDGTSRTYSNWKNSNPGASDKYCAKTQKSTDGLWENEDCTQSHHYVCKYPVDSTTTQMTSSIAQTTSTALITTSTTLPITSTAQSTTSTAQATTSTTHPITSTVQATTSTTQPTISTVQPTILSQPTTSPQPTTSTQSTTTSPQPTTSQQPTATSPQLTTTSQPTTTSPQPTASPQSTTTSPQPTTSQQPTVTSPQLTTTSQPTTASSQPTTPQPTTTSPQPTASTQSTTTSPQPTTSQQPTATSPQLTTTSQPTTTSPQPTATSPQSTTTSPQSTTTSPQPTASPQSTTSPQPTTSQQPTATSPQLTTSQPTTTSPQPTTTSPPSTTSQPTTTSLQPTASPQSTTTSLQPTTSQQPTAASPQLTTSQPTTTSPQSTTTSPLSTTSQPITTSLQPTAATPQPTTSPEPTTVSTQPTTSPKPTTSPESTTTSQPTTKSPQSTTTSSMTAATNSSSTSMNHQTMTTSPLANSVSLPSVATTETMISATTELPTLRMDETTEIMTNENITATYISKVGLTTTGKVITNSSAYCDAVCTPVFAQDIHVTKQGGRNIHTSTSLMSHEMSEGRGSGATSATASTAGHMGTRDVSHSQEYAEADHVMETLASLPPDVQKKISSQADQLIVDCQFAGVSCSHRDFDVTWNPVHGNCLVFNSGWNNTIPWRQSYRPGSRHGLTVILNIGQADYMYLSGITDMAGARISVHQPGVVAFPEDEGINILTGKSTFLGIRKKVVTREKAPYGECVPINLHNTSLNMYQDRHPVNYSRKACERTCYQAATVRECGCFDPHISIHRQWRNIQVCRNNNTYEDYCRRNVSLMMKTKQLKCDCAAPCIEDVYGVTTSHSLWPTDIMKADFLQTMVSAVPSLFNDSTDVAKFKRNLLKVNILYQEFNVEHVDEIIAYTTTKFMSDIGGMLGLWFGCSVFTLVEFIELFLDTGYAVLRRRNNPRTIEVPDASHLDHRMFYIFKDTETERQLERKLPGRTSPLERPCTFGKNVNIH